LPRRNRPAGPGKVINLDVRRAMLFNIFWTTEFSPSLVRPKAPASPRRGFQFDGRGGRIPYHGDAPDLTDADIAALIHLLRGAIDGDRYPLSPRILNLKVLLAKLDPASVPPAHPRPPQKLYAPPRAVLTRRRRGR
jgi:hypothetical protein